MNKIWTFVILVSIAVLLFFSPGDALTAMLNGSSSAVSLSIELLAIYAVWLGIIGIIENTNLSKVISKLLSPLINKLWGKNIKPSAKSYISLSLSTSLLGIGGASVPLGIRAIEELDDKTGVATFPMIMTIVFACSGIQLIPTTIMSLLSNAGSADPSFIILPTILSGLSTTITGVVLAIICEKVSKKRKNKSRKASL